MNARATTIMGFAAIFISLLSLFAVIYQSILAREENELIRIQQGASVLPYLDFWYSNVGDKYVFVLENKGVGPAFIKEATFFAKDSTGIDTLTFGNSNQLCDYITSQSGFLDSLYVVRSPIQKNMLLSPNEEKQFFWFALDNEAQKAKFRKEFYTYYAGASVIYADVYGTQWQLDSDKRYPIKLEAN